MTAGNNRKENTFKTPPQPQPEPVEEPEVVSEEPKKESPKPKKESPKKNDKTTKGKGSKSQKTNVKQRHDSRLKKIIGILFICLAMFLGIALISYLVSFFSGHHQEYGYQIFASAHQRILRHRSVFLCLPTDSHWFAHHRRCQNQDMGCLEIRPLKLGLDANVLWFPFKPQMRFQGMRHLWRCGRTLAQ